MIRRPSLAFVSVPALVLALGSCAEDDDFVRVVVRGIDPSLVTAPLDLSVLVTGAGTAKTFAYKAQIKARDATTTDISDFTLSFGKPDDARAKSAVDVRIVTQPSGARVDWGGHVRVLLPGDGRDVGLSLTEGETPIQDIAPLDGDGQTLASYGQEIVLAWPSPGGKAAYLTTNPDRPTGTSRPTELGLAVSKVRVASRPSRNFPSDMFAVSWINEGSVPMLQITQRNQAPPPPVAVGSVIRATDLHVACARDDLDPAVASAAIVEGNVSVHVHDTMGATLAGPLVAPGLDRVNRIVGIAVTPGNTVTVALNGNDSRLVKVPVAGGAPKSVPIRGRAVAMSTSSDSNAIYVATLDGSDLLIETFDTFEEPGLEPAPRRTAFPATRVASFDLVAGVAASRVAIGSCAIAWPEKRKDADGALDIFFQSLDAQGQPVGEPHLANVSSGGQHYSPSVHCFSETRAFVSMIAADSVGAPIGKLAVRRLPTEQR